MPYSLNLRGRIVMIERPWVVGVVNATPDSFHAASRVTADDAERHIAAMVAAGADMLDIGACSTRPGSTPPSASEELARLTPVMAAARHVAPRLPVSVDTYRADVARAAVLDMGADIINDIGGGTLDDDMFATVAGLRVPYILGHTRGTPHDMLSLTDYAPDGVVATVAQWLLRRADELHQRGVADVICDPGFGFAKTAAQCHELMAALGDLVSGLQMPVMAGVSRKRMVAAVTGSDTDLALAGTTAFNTLAMAAGVHMVRVHDVAAAVAARDAVQAVRQAHYRHNDITLFDNPHPTI